MAGIYDFVVPVAYAPEDNNSFVQKQLVFFKQCVSVLVSECDGFNFNRCPNDDNYQQPFIKGDVLYIQVPSDTRAYDNADIVMVNADGDEVPFTFVKESGNSDLRNKYFNFIIDTDQEAFELNSCFYFKIKMCKIGTECVQYDYIATEPYKEVQCGESTFMIEGTYPKYDCKGNYYAPFIAAPTTNSFKCQTRVYGTIEQSDFNISETTSGNKRRTSTTLSNLFNLQTAKIPLYVAEKMALCFTGKEYFINNIEYKGSVKFNKNFEEGSMWIVKVALQSDCDENNFTCS